MRINRAWHRYHLTRMGWMDAYSFNHIMGRSTERLLTRQYGELEEVDYCYYKDTWKHEDHRLIEIYLALYPHPVSNMNYQNYHKVNNFPD